MMLTPNQPPVQDPTEAILQQVRLRHTITERRLSMRAHEVCAVVQGWLSGGSMPKTYHSPPVRPVPYKGRVLLVEDDKDFACSVATVLGRHGFQVVTADSVSEAIKALEEEGFALVLVDFDLRDGFGSEVIEHARTNPATRIILMTGLVPDLLPKIAAQLRITEVLPKPFLPEELLLTLGQPTTELVREDVP